jgi:GNAT superfamily N-acetyltransferase
MFPGGQQKHGRKALLKMNIRVCLVDPFSDSETVRDIVSCYQRAFGGAPWNEGYLCPHPECGDVFPLSLKSERCPSCAARGNETLLVEYWPADRVASDFYREMKKPDALCFVAKDDEKIAGFIWGYRIIADESIDDYLEAPGLQHLIAGEFFYIDDVAVNPGYQGRGIGRALVSRLLKERSEMRILARTLDQSAMFHILASFRGETVLAITRGRVIVAVPS